MQLLRLASVMAATMAASASAHSWVMCVDTEVPNLAEAIANPTIDPQETCHGYPRNDVYNGDWISQSTYYAYNLNTTSACKANQQSATYTDDAPMATATPGQSLLMRYGGNGHTSWAIGSPQFRDPGVVRVFWAGQKETEIVNKSDLTQQYWIKGAQANFSAEAVTLIDQGATNVAGMHEKANYFNFTLPTEIENGRHMFVWAWAWDESLTSGNTINAVSSDEYDTQFDHSWSTCFDVEITGSSFTGMNSQIADSIKTYANAASSEDEEVCSQTCYRGGQLSVPCTGSDCPPCWYKQKDVNGDYQIMCYDYSDASSKTCPWSKSYDCSTSTASGKRDTEHLNAHKHKRHVAL